MNGDRMAERLQNLSFWALATLLCVTAGCASQKIVEDTSASITVRFDGYTTSLDDATATAVEACTRRHKTARLRSVDKVAIAERYAHFSCS